MHPDIFDTLEKWKNGSIQQTFKQIEDISNKVHVPLGYFFLHSPPKEEFPIIVSACTRGYTVVTCETSNKGLNPNNPSKIAKNPDICDHFSVECNDLFQMMRNLNFKL